MPLADIDFGEGLLFILEFFLLVAWFWITIIGGNGMRDRKLNDPKGKGALSAEEYQQAMAKILA